MKLFLRSAFFHQHGGELENVRALWLRKLVFVYAQDKYVRELETLCAMHGHEAHGVPRRIVFKTDGASGLLKIVQIFNKLRELARIALSFPLLNKFSQVMGVVA